jgi:hypothetical protein
MANTQPVDAWMKRGLLVMLGITLGLLCVTLLSHAYLSYRIAELVYQGQQLTVTVHNDIRRIEDRVQRMDERAQAAREEIRDKRDELMDRVSERLGDSRVVRAIMEEEPTTAPATDQEQPAASEDMGREEFRDVAIRKGVKLLTSDKTRDWLRERLARHVEPQSQPADPINVSPDDDIEPAMDSEP